MVAVKDTLVFIILSGIPCSGKSTWIERNSDKLRRRFDAPVITLSKDIIRAGVYGDLSNWKWDKEKEKIVDARFWKQLGFMATLKRAVVIIDNTHTTESRIDTYFKIFKTMIDNGGVEIYVRFFDVSLMKAKTRDLLRKMSTGKYIPMDVMNQYHFNYQKIDKNKYKDHLFYDE